MGTEMLGFETTILLSTARASKLLQTPKSVYLLEPYNSSCNVLHRRFFGVDVFAALGLGTFTSLLVICSCPCVLPISPQLVFSCLVFIYPSISPSVLRE